jgi:hypothetical protein
MMLKRVSGSPKRFPTFTVNRSPAAIGNSCVEVAPVSGISVRRPCPGVVVVLPMSTYVSSSVDPPCRPSGTTHDTAVVVLPSAAWPSYHGQSDHHIARSPRIGCVELTVNHTGPVANAASAGSDAASPLKYTVCRPSAGTV